MRKDGSNSNKSVSYRSLIRSLGKTFVKLTPWSVDFLVFGPIGTSEKIELTFERFDTVKATTSKL